MFTSVCRRHLTRATTSLTARTSSAANNVPRLLVTNSAIARAIRVPRRAYSTEKPDPKPTQSTAAGQRDRATVGVFTPKAAALFVATAIGLFFYFKHEKEKLQEEREKALQSRSVGRALVGGPFSLITHDGKPFTEKNLVGQWTLLYFGFTNCPDICPTEMDKMSEVVDEIDKNTGVKLAPLFVSVDPARDTPDQLKTYLADFHPRFTALVGSYEDTKKMCKAYRVYFSTPPNTKPGDDYLVDHSIFVYLLDPDGKFVEAFGQSSTKEDIVERTQKELKEWEAEKGLKH